jgi:hypothetical protein
MTTRQLEITVVFTTVEATRDALKKAELLASDLGARIRLIVPQVIPYPVSLDTPPVQCQFVEEEFRALVADPAVETKVDIRYCRDRWLMLKDALEPGAIVVLPARLGLSSEGAAIAKRLRQAENHVLVFKKPEPNVLCAISLWFLYDFLMRWYIS